jgi:UDP-N-acetylglucosamine/UDP-N-acetylgalactosamine diphosphorylase
LIDNKNESALAYQNGIEAISRGEVAALVLAGGQGTRLGFAGPKGMYDIGLPSGRTLFQLLAERLKRLQQVASNSIDDLATPQLKNACSCPFYIMTSPINHEQTVNFFKENDYFGLSETNVLFFQQGMLPCMTNEGKMIMETSSEIAMAPDG